MSVRPCFPSPRRMPRPRGTPAAGRRAADRPLRFLRLGASSHPCAWSSSGRHGPPWRHAGSPWCARCGARRRSAVLARQAAAAAAAAAVAGRLGMGDCTKPLVPFSSVPSLRMTYTHGVERAAPAPRPVAHPPDSRSTAPTLRASRRNSASSLEQPPQSVVPPRPRRGLFVTPLTTAKAEELFRPSGLAVARPSAWQSRPCQIWAIPTTRPRLNPTPRGAPPRRERAEREE